VYRFGLRNPFGHKRGGDRPARVKLFTEKEIKEESEHMIAVYMQGSALLDDVIEIVTKDHEEVSIWALSEDEASTLALIHLQRATHDEQAARSARTLLDIYDRFYAALILVPRVKATYTYCITEHGGFSFK